MFVDEAAVTTAMVRARGRAPKGQRAYGTAPAGTRRRLTVLGALGAGGVAGAMSIERATDTAVFLAYLDQALIPELARRKPGAVVIMDNLSAHKRPAVRARLEAAGLELLRLPRYSPDLNPNRGHVVEGQGGAAGGGGAHGRGAGGGPRHRPGPHHGRRRPRLLPRLRLRRSCQLIRNLL